MPKLGNRNCVDGIVMTNRQKELWRVQVIVEPEVRWDSIGINAFKVAKDEAINLEKQLEGRTKFSITALSDIAGIHSRAEVLMKSFLASLEVEAQRGYRFSIGSMKPVKPMSTKDGWLLTHHFTGTIRVVRKFEDLNLGLLKELSNSLEALDMEKRNRILGALEFLYDGLTAHTPQQRFLSMYGGLNYLIASEVKAGKTTRREDLIAISFEEKGILRSSEVKEWIADFEHFDTVHYHALHGKEFNEEEVDKIREFFAEFVIKYIQYLKASLPK